MSLTAALPKIDDNTIPSANLIANIIYLNPRAIGWQIPLHQQFPFPGVPIAALTIGAMVLSIEITTGWIEALELKCFSFKHGFIDALPTSHQKCKYQPNFPGNS